MSMTVIATAADAAATEACGARLAQVCAGRGVIFLHGELGAGKTTLTRGILHGLGHAGAVKSPTYTLVEPYVLASGDVFHFDLYRLLDPEELELMGYRDYFRADALTLVEWPERGEPLLPTPDLELFLRPLAVAGGIGREVAATAHSAHGAAMLARLSA